MSPTIDMSATIALLLGVVTLLLMTSDATNQRRGFVRRLIDESRLTRSRDTAVEQTADALDTIRLTAVTSLTSCTKNLAGAVELNEKIYVVCQNHYGQDNAHRDAKILVYDARNFTFEQEISLNLPNSEAPLLINAHHKFNRLYISTYVASPISVSIWEVNPNDWSVVNVMEGLKQGASFSITKDGALVVSNVDEILVFDVSGVVQQVNRTALELNGFVAKEAVLLTSGNFLLITRNRFSTVRELLEIKPDGQIGKSYSARKLLAYGSFHPFTLTLFNDQLGFVADWSGASDSIFVFSTNLTRERLLLRGEGEGVDAVEHPYQMTYNERTRLLIVRMLFENTPRLYRVTFEQV